MEVDIRTNKRKFYDEDNDYEIYDNPRLNKKQKMELTTDMIYAIGSEIHFTSDVSQESMEKLIKLMTKIIHEHESKYKDEKKKMTITYVVTSYGGSVHAVLKFVDFIKMVKMKYPHISFTSIATGCIASAGTTMAAVADKRLASTRSIQMLHQLSSGMSGKYVHMMSYSKHLTTLHNILLDVYMDAKPNVTREEMEVILAEETWLSAEEYKKLGLIHDIISEHNIKNL
jgi:ATP-dependent protease ClpP protease subunit